MNFHSLYLHLPYCETKCHYCDFYSIAIDRTRSSERARLYRSVLREIERRQESIREVQTIFMGGGTPSLSELEALREISEKVRTATVKEWTLEANPSSVELQKFRELRSLGINRVSLGVQSLRDDHLKLLGRVHNRHAALQAIETILEAGIRDLSVDLLCGVPGQTPDDIENFLKTLTQFPISHLSCYLLTLSPTHSMFKKLPSEDEQLEHYLFVHEWMTQNGFEHYEISNFSRGEKTSKHNLAYWTGQSYLGMGPSAHSFDGKKTRWKNVSSIKKYCEQVEAGKHPIDFEEVLNPTQLEIEKWMLGLRLNTGIPKKWAKTPELQKEIEVLVSEALLEEHPKHPDRVRATPRGWALSDTVLGRLVRRIGLESA